MYKYYGVAMNSRLLRNISLVEYRLFYRVFFLKKRMFLGSLLIVATSYWIYYEMLLHVQYRNYYWVYLRKRKNSQGTICKITTESTMKCCCMCSVWNTIECTIKKNLVKVQNVKLFFNLLWNATPCTVCETLLSVP